MRDDAPIIALVHSSCVLTIVTPALEPLPRGLATSGRFKLPGNNGSVPPNRSNVSQAGVGNPSAASSFLVRCLSIASAHAATPLPVYGIPIHSSTP